MGTGVQLHCREFFVLSSSGSKDPSPPDVADSRLQTLYNGDDGHPRRPPRRQQGATGGGRSWIYLDANSNRNCARRT